MPGVMSISRHEYSRIERANWQKIAIFLEWAKTMEPKLFTDMSPICENLWQKVGSNKRHIKAIGDDAIWCEKTIKEIEIRLFPVLFSAKPTPQFFPTRRHGQGPASITAGDIICQLYCNDMSFWGHPEFTTTRFQFAESLVVLRPRGILQIEAFNPPETCHELVGRYAWPDNRFLLDVQRSRPEGQRNTGVVRPKGPRTHFQII